MKKLFASLLFVFCFQPLFHICAASTPVALNDYGDPQANNVWRHLRDLKERKSSETIHIIQLGDSHTGGDYFTGRLREQLQNAFGNAGLGWLTPGNILNQRSDQAVFKNLGKWQLFDSKISKDDILFPTGGLINFAENEALIEMQLKRPLLDGHWRISLWQQTQKYPWHLLIENGSAFKFPINKSPNDNFPTDRNSNDQWQISYLDLDNIQSETYRFLAPQNSKLGGIIFDRNAPGITLDAIGNNGSVAGIMSRWDDITFQHQLEWRNPMLIILAYGTNEGFDSKFMLNDYETDLRRNIKRLRAYAPNAAILLLGLPSGAKKSQPNANAGCATPIPPSFAIVKQLQQQIAKDEHTLYWDWSEFMGGRCAASQWLNQKPPLMRPDMVHLTADGYKLSADGFFHALMDAVTNN